MEIQRKHVGSGKSFLHKIEIEIDGEGFVCLGDRKTHLRDYVWVRAFEASRHRRLRPFVATRWKQIGRLLNF